eukprot:XP_001705133.1 Hypothetical protein GL50803_34692 [Giardia lamblia ATCC 50803]
MHDLLLVGSSIHGTEGRICGKGLHPILRHDDSQY